MEDLDRIRAYALVAPRERAAFRPEVVRLGRSSHVVVEMHDGPASWSTAVVAAKAEMNRLGLKRPERYDAAFRPHVTLASARRNAPDPAEATALEQLGSWLAERAASDPARYTVTLGPDTPVRLWLAGTKRPPGAPNYVDVDEVLAGR